MKNTFYLVIADLASKGVGGLLGLVLARFLGVFDYGKYAIAVSISGLFLLITAVGFEQLLTRRGGLDPNTLHGALKLNVICLVLLTISAYVAMGIFLVIGDYSTELTTLTLAAGMALIIARFHLPFRSYWLARKNILPVAIAQSFGTFVILLGTLLILYYSGSVLNIIFLQGVIAALVLAFYWKSLPANTGDSQVVNANSLYGFFKDSIPFGLSSMIWVAYFNFDVVMLSMFESEKAVGLYGGLYRIMAVSYIIGYALTNSLTPRLYQLYESREFSQYLSTGKRLVGSVSLVGLVFAMILVTWSDSIINLILGPQYLEGAIVLQILGISAFFRFANFALCEILTTTDHQQKRVRIEFLVLLINIVGNALLIPRYGAAGAALATLASEFCLTILVCGFLRRHSLMFVRA